MEKTSLFLVVSLSATLVFLIYRQNSFKDPLFWVALFYFYFAFGPVLNFLFGKDIYPGIIIDTIFESSITFMLAIFSIFIVTFFYKYNIKANNKASFIYKQPLLLWNIVLIILLLYSGYVLFFILPNFQGLSKSSKLLYAGRFHYQYLLIQMSALSCYFLIRHSRYTRSIYFLNFALYIGYCIGFYERDFIFIIFSLLLHKSLIESDVAKFSQYLSLSTLALFSVVLAIYIANWRQGLSINNVLMDVLNQGSILFVSTNIIDWTQKGLPFRYGITYLNSILNLLPETLHSRDTAFYLARWFKFIYAPGGSSQYGFSLDAEAYLNFGYSGILIVFTGLALMQRYILNRIEKYPFCLYLSVFYIAFLMYALRNDSLALVSGIFYAISLFFVIHTCSKFMRLEKRYTSFCVTQNIQRG